MKSLLNYTLKKFQGIFLPKDKSKLCVHEWLAVVLATSAILGIAVVSSRESNHELVDLNAAWPIEGGAQWIAISVTGAVENPGKFNVAEGSRVCDLKNLVSLKSEADKRFFNKRRKLKENETLFVPVKPAKKAAHKK